MILQLIENFCNANNQNTVDYLVELIQYQANTWVTEQYTLEEFADNDFSNIQHLGYLNWQETYEKIGFFAVQMQELTQKTSKKNQFDFAKKILKIPLINVSQVGCLCSTTTTPTNALALST